jgi:6-phosphogluconolactonase
MTRVQVLPSADDLARAASWYVQEKILQAARERGRVLLVLSGGSTPLPVYERLVKLALPWSRTHIFWGDERCVPVEDSLSNYGNAHRALISNVPIPDGNVHRIQGELSPEDAAQAYEYEIRGFFGSEPPIMDLILLGVGPDGHTASLFPGGQELGEVQRWAVNSEPPPGTEPAVQRVSLTLPLINQARAVLFLAAGKDKRPVTSSVLRVLGNGSDLPAGLVRPNGELAWFLDHDAAPGLG